MFSLQYFQTTRYHSNENFTIADWIVASKYRTVWKTKILTGSEINVVIFSKIKQTAFDDFLGLLDELKMLALVIFYRNQSRVYIEENQ